MNGEDFVGGTSGGKKINPGPRPKKGKDQRDEDLVLFREMFKQERASTVNLLDSVEFESNVSNTVPLALHSQASNIPLFDGTNFSEWNEQVQFSLGVLDLDMSLLVDEPAAITATSSAAEKEAHKAWSRSNRLSMMFLRMTVATSIKTSLPEAKTAKEYLNNVKERFKAAGKSLASKLLDEITTMRFDGSRTMSNHVIEMTNLAAKLRNLGMNLDDSLIVQLVLNSLPAQYGPFQINYNTIKDKWNVNELQSMLVEEERRLKQRNINVAHFVTKGAGKGKFGKGKKQGQPKFDGSSQSKKKDKRNERCRWCKKIGHFQNECMKRKAWFENKGNYQFYRQASARRGYEFLPDSGKSDYDWLKTPPATPLFASLEMDAGINAPELVVQREIPILQPLSRFSGNPIPAEKSSSAGNYKFPKPKPIPEDLLVVPNVNLRPIRTTVIPPPEPKARTTKFKNPATSITQKTTPQMSTTSKRISTTSVTTKVSTKTTNQPPPPPPKQQKSPNLNFLASKLSKSMQQGPPEPKSSKPKSRGVSPLVRSTINFAGISNETPPNLKTDRDKSVNKTRRTDTTPLKRENNYLKTQSRSSSVGSIRSVEPKEETNKGNGTQVLGSRMVDRFMSARKSSTTTTTKIVEERETRTKLRVSLNEGSGFERRVSKSSLDGAFKHMKD